MEKKAPRSFRWWFDHAAIASVAAGAVIFFTVRSDSQSASAMQDGFTWIGDRIGKISIPVDTQTVKRRLPAIELGDSSRQLGDEDTWYVVLKRDGEAVSVAIPAVDATTPTGTLETFDRLIATREHARVVRIFNTRGEYIGIFVNGHYQSRRR